MANNISDRIQLGNTGIYVSPVGFGVLPMGPNQLALPVDEGAELICYALKCGINFIDTAQYYQTYPYIRRAFEMLGIAGGEPSANADAGCENRGGGSNTADFVFGAASGSEPQADGSTTSGSAFPDMPRATCGDTSRGKQGDEPSVNAVASCQNRGRGVCCGGSVSTADFVFGAASGSEPRADGSTTSGSALPDMPPLTCGDESRKKQGSSSCNFGTDISAALPQISRPVISSKTLKTDYDGAYSAILEECERLGVSYIDIFLLHEVRSGQFAKRQAAWHALQDAKSAGLVRAIGISTHHVDVVEELTAVAECDVIFPLLNYAGMGVRRGSEASSCEDMAAAVAAAALAGKGIYIMKVLGGGNLASHYQTALDYVFSQQGVNSVMLGFGCKKDIDDILAYLDGSMPPDYAPDISNKRVRINQEDCEGCGTCLRICHSAAIGYNKNGLAEIDQSKCITCGYCAQSCPVRAIIMY